MQQEQAEWDLRDLRLKRKHQDPLDIFVRFILVRGATVYILINITLLIWLVQTVLTSNLQQYPRSIYIILPLLSSKPITDIKFMEGPCPPNTQKLLLKSFPTVKDVNIIRKNLTEWRLQNHHFCVKRIQNQFNNNTDCSLNEIYCSGYCVSDKSNCPITSIVKLKSKEQITGQYTQLYSIPSLRLYYAFTRGQGRPIVSIINAFDKKCANDWRYYDQYDTLQRYLQDAYTCGKQGQINSIFIQFDSMTINSFFKVNNLTNINYENKKKSQKKMQIGYVYRIPFDTKVDSHCSQIQRKVSKLDKYSFTSISPSFPHIILIGCFVLFCSSWIWLIGFYCCQGMIKQKNMIAVLMSVIELIIISYIFYQNRQIFESDQFLNEVHKCIQSTVKSSYNWNYGIQSPRSFLMVIYSNIVFLTLITMSYIVNKYMYASQ